MTQEVGKWGILLLNENNYKLIRKMKILIDIGHPGHVHYFKNLVFELTAKRHEIKVVARDRDVIIELLNKLKLTFVNRGKGKNSKIGKILYMIKADIQILDISLRFKPDMFISFSSPYAAQVAYLLGKPHIALTDTEHADKLLSKFTYPFSSIILTPESYLNDLGDKHIKFNSVVEGLYLHKQYYQPDKNIKKSLGLKNSDEYIIIRFVSWNAHHDFGHHGLDEDVKYKLIELLKDRFKIFISSEGDLPKDLLKYKINISPEKMHDVLSGATLFIGESATMASESAMLGTKAVYINSLPLMGYLKLEQDFGLLRYFKTSEGIIKYISDLLLNPKLKKEALENSELMQKNFINPTKFLTYIVENYSKTIKEDLLELNIESEFS